MESALVKDCAARRKQENDCKVFRIEAVQDLIKRILGNSFAERFLVVRMSGYTAQAFCRNPEVDSLGISKGESFSYLPELTEMCRTLLRTQGITAEKVKITNTMELK